MEQSIQKLLLRIRPPRVRITYDVETGGAVQSKELPFVLGIISDLYGHQGDRVDFKERKFVYIDRDNFSNVMQSIKPKLNISVSNMLVDQDAKSNKKSDANDTLAVELSFNSMDDLSPANIAKKVPQLNNMLLQHELLIDLSAKLDSNHLLHDMLSKAIADKGLFSKLAAEAKDVTKPCPEMDKLIKESGLCVIEDNDKKSAESSDYLIRCRKMVASLFGGVSDLDGVTNLYPYIMDMVAKIDEKISLQLDEILHHEAFQKLEASWRGVHYVVMNSETGENLKIRLFAATRDEVQDDLERASEFDQSTLFKRVYEEEFGTLGGSPYSCLVADFYIGRKAMDVAFVRKLSQVASAAHAPLLGAASPDMFDLKSYNELHIPRDLKKIFESSELVAWNSFRDTEDSRYINLFLPRVLVRLPYGQNTIPIKEFNYNESVDGMDNSKFCWGNPAYAMALRITTAYAQYGWTAAIRGIEGGGLVQNLPAYTFKTSYGDIALKCPTEVMITDRREKELSDLGFIALCHNKGTDKAVFFSAQSTQRPKEYDLPSATANAALSARLTYMLNVSRFAHYIKMLMRDKIGSFESGDDIQLYLNNWIARYVFLSDQGDQEVKAKYPLREAEIEVVADEENPGAYKAVIFLKPHFQLEELEVSLRLVANLPSQ